MRVENYCIVSVCVVNGKVRLCVREIFSPVKMCVVIVFCVVCVDSVFSSIRETREVPYAPVCFVPLHPPGLGEVDLPEGFRAHER